MNEKGNERALVIEASHGSLDDAQLTTVARALDGGGVVVVPTDTVYGLAVNALNPAAVERVFVVKGRESGKPLPVVVRDLEQVRSLAVDLSDAFVALARRFWPGPLTLIVRARAGLPAALTAGGDTLAVRQPGSAVLAALLRRVDYPLTATSANLSGSPVATSAAEALAQLGGSVDLIVDAGLSPRAVPSTLVDVTGTRPRIVRPGAVPTAELEAFWAEFARQ